MRIVPLYAAVLALVFVALSLQTIRLRREVRVAIGVSQVPEPRSLRVMGIALIFTSPIAAALWLLAAAFSH